MVVFQGMVVSLLLLILELPESSTIKDKRSVVTGIKNRLRSKYRISCAEVGLLDSLSFAEIGGALVSNSSVFGEKVLYDAVRFVETYYPVNIHETQVHSEVYE